MKRVVVLVLALTLATATAAKAQSAAAKTAPDPDVLRTIQQLVADPATRDEIKRALKATEKQRGAGKQPPATSISAKKKEVVASGGEADEMDYATRCKEEDWFFTLRQDWKDVKFLTCPADPAKAHGVEFSYANDRANANKVWSVNGTAALSRTWHVDGQQPYRKAFGAYFTMNRVSNSNAASSSDNVDKYAYGLAAEAFWSTVPVGGAIRLRAGGVENNIKKTSASNFVLEFLPAVAFGGGLGTYRELEIIHGQHPVGVSIEPTLIAQYNALTGRGQSLDFNDQSRAFQTGGDISLVFGATQYYLYQLKMNKEDSWFARWNANVGYRWTRETYSNRDLTLFTAGLTYNLDRNGHFGLGFSYQRGNEADTGTFTNIYRMGLTAKF